MTLFYRNAVVSMFWLLIAFLVIQTQTSQMFLSILFTVFVLHFSEDLLQTKMKLSLKIAKPLGLLLSIGILSSIVYGLFVAFSFMISDFNALINTSDKKLLSFLSSYGYDYVNLEELYSVIMEFAKQNMGFLTFSLALLFKVVLGILLGVILHMSPIEKVTYTNSWDNVLGTILEQSQVLFKSFKNIMGIQVLISLMNTSIVGVFSTLLSWLVFGDFLPYWYVIIPLTALLSLVPVVGNVLINIVLALSIVQVDPYYIVAGLALFAIIHKLELIVIGKKMKAKVNVPFVVILFSMVLGELLFHSMSGMMLGMIVIVAVSFLMKDVKIKLD